MVRGKKTHTKRTAKSKSASSKSKSLHQKRVEAGRKGGLAPHKSRGRSSSSW